MAGNAGTMSILERSFAPSLALAAAVLVSLPSSARAQASTKPAEGAKPEDDSGAHLSGIEIMARPTIGGAGAQSPLHVAPGVRTVGDVPSILTGASPYGTAVGVGAAVGFRFHPLFSMGFRGDIQQISASAPDGTSDLSRGRQSAGLYARGYPLALSESLRRYVDPWASIGVAYVHDGQSFHHPAATTLGTSIDAAWSLDQHAIGVPIGIGLDYRLTRAIAVGPSFEYMFLAPIAGCAKQSAAGFQDNRMCTDSSGPQALAMDALGSWTVGIDLRLTPFR